MYIQIVDKVLSHEKTWRNLKISRSEQPPYSEIPTVYRSRKGRNVEQSEDQWLAEVRKREKREGRPQAMAQASVLTYSMYSSKREVS